MFKKAGFKQVQVEAQSGIFTTWIVKMNYFSRRIIRGPIALKVIINGLLIPFWAIGQVLAPYLDKLSRNWNAETHGYFVLAKKD